MTFSAVIDYVTMSLLVLHTIGTNLGTILKLFHSRFLSQSLLPTIHIFSTNIVSMTTCTVEMQSKLHYTNYSNIPKLIISNLCDSCRYSRLGLNLSRYKYFMETCSMNFSMASFLKLSV